MASAAKPMRDPPILLHACKEFAIFSIKANNGKCINVKEIIELTTLRSCISTSSLQSSDSDSSLTYRSPAIQGPYDLSPTCAISRLPNPGAIRSRSQSECDSSYPKKGILKRESICRSLSECHEPLLTNQVRDNVNQTDRNNLALMKSCQKCDKHRSSSETSSDFEPRFDCLCFAGGDCTDIVLDEISAYSNSLLSAKKRSVTFCERVEENIFRPGSSILGQRKKNQRKAVGKTRKRKESCDSMLSLEEMCEDSCNDDVKSLGDKEIEAVQTENDNVIKNNDDDQDLSAEQQPSGNNSYLHFNGTFENQCARDADTDVLEKNQEQLHNEVNKTKNCKKKKLNEKKNCTPPVQHLVICEKYKGFVVNPVVLSPSIALANKNDALTRLDSVDSALSVDIGDDDDDVTTVDNLDHRNLVNNYCPCVESISPPQLVSINFENHLKKCASLKSTVSVFRFESESESDCAFIDSSNRKDSGIDDEMEQLCEQMCEAVVSDDRNDDHN